MAIVIFPGISFLWLVTKLYCFVTETCPDLFHNAYLFRYLFVIGKHAVEEIVTVWVESRGWLGALVPVVCTGQLHCVVCHRLKLVDVK